MTYEEYKMIDTPEGVHLEPCPVCAAKAELWRRSESNDSPTETAVCCANGEGFGPQSGIASEGCLLYMPPDDFYRGTIREAVKYWNEYARTLESQRRARRWESAKVLREAASDAVTDAKGENDATV